MILEIEGGRTRSHSRFGRGYGAVVGQTTEWMSGTRTDRYSNILSSGIWCRIIW